MLEIKIPISVARAFVSFSGMRHYEAERYLTAVIVEALADYDPEKDIPKEGVRKKDKNDMRIMKFMEIDSEGQQKPVWIDVNKIERFRIADHSENKHTQVYLDSSVGICLDINVDALIAVLVK